jgi:hypothetical protein
MLFHKICIISIINYFCELVTVVLNEGFKFNNHMPVHRNNILIYIRQDARLHSLFYLETALHVLGGTTTHHQERKQLYLQYVQHLLL